MRERALREMGLAPGWVRRHAEPVVALTELAGRPAQSLSADEREPRAQMHVEVRALDLEALGAAVERCQACARAATRSRAVAGEGSPSARLVVIDHVPSQLDATHGALRDGDAARIFDKLLFALGVKREAIYLSHALRCDGSVPTDGERASCAPYLQRELELIAPRAVLALGSAAAAAVAPVWHQDAPRVFALPHPGELLSDARRKRAAWVVLRELRAYLASDSS